MLLAKVEVLVETGTEVVGGAIAFLTIGMLILQIGQNSIQQEIEDKADDKPAVYLLRERSRRLDAQKMGVLWVTLAIIVVGYALKVTGWSL